MAQRDMESWFDMEGWQPGVRLRGPVEPVDGGQGIEVHSPTGTTTASIAATALAHRYEPPSRLGSSLIILDLQIRGFCRYRLPRQPCRLSRPLHLPSFLPQHRLRALNSSPASLACNCSTRIKAFRYRTSSAHRHVACLPLARQSL